MAEQWPSVGRIIHVTGTGSCRAAVIVEMLGSGPSAGFRAYRFPTQPEGAAVPLSAFVDDVMGDNGAIVSSASGWHWPEYVGPQAPLAEVRT